MADAERSKGARNGQVQSSNERVLPLQLHTLSIGMRTILLVPLLSAAVLVVGRRTDVEMGPLFGLAFVAVAVSAGLATPLPYERLFRTRGDAGRVRLVGCEPRLIAIGIWATGGSDSPSCSCARPHDTLLCGRIHASNSSRLLRDQCRELLGGPRCLEIEPSEPGGAGSPRLPREPAGWSAEESDGRPQGGTTGV
jgi:hypothetical protein